MDVLSYYKQHAQALAEQYNSLKAEEVHASWKKQLPKTPGLACDIGAGSGRDAYWLAQQGWDVIAVEPCKELAAFGQAFIKEKPSTKGSVTWLNDKLPELKKLRIAGYRFNLILLSAVWMHIPQKKRERAFRIISELLAPGGKLIISLRHGSDEKENQARGFLPVSAEELQQFARQRALALTSIEAQGDKLQRKKVSWQTLSFQLPDDGTGSLPVLRHIIVNDNKSATYKLGLIRVLIRIAEGAPGMVLKRTDSSVTIPFGLVALYWLKLYMPLVLKHNIIQAPKADHQNQSGYGWANVNFWNLKNLAVNDLRIGAHFIGDDAKHIMGAINRACDNIQKMPAHFITWPGTNKPIFECERKNVTATQHFLINRENLAAYGEFQIPAALWQTLGQYACWLEPAIVNEWVDVMHPWNQLYDKNSYFQALAWNEANRDTRIARQRAHAVQLQLEQQGQHLQCVYTNSKLKGEKYHVDHCFPWSRWYNNDLWNLLPACKTCNQNKKDKLLSAPMMHNAKTNILSWWQEAYVESEFKQQFLMEAQASLPLFEESDQQLENIFEAMLHQRAKLKVNQGLVEWGS